MSKISVIVPVFNVENYIAKCLDSLINQTLDDIEIILVNDGSTDNSQKIINEYTTNNNHNKKIISLIKENGGMSDARNYGLSYASGEYISFIDSDDYVESNMLEVMYNKAKEADYDIVYCNVDVVYPDKNLSIKAELEKDLNSLTLDDKNKLMLHCYPVVWNKIYKKSLLFKKNYEDDGLFKKGVWFEDARMLYKLIPDITSAAIVPDELYHYIQRPKSITYTYNSKLYDILSNLENIIEYYKSEGIYNDYKDVLEYIYIKYLYATFIKRLAKSKDRDLFMKGFIQCKKKVKEIYPNFRKNKYLKGMRPKNLYLKYFNRFLANLVFIKEKNSMN